MYQRFLVFLILWVALAPPAFSQNAWKWMTPADTLSKQRFWGTVGAGAAIYTGVSYGLYQTWYKDYERGKFRTFNDAREWQQMDKAGHFITTYSEARWLYDGARWTGLDKRRSLWLAGGISMFLQGTLEVMDGFSTEWGFSWSDVGFNTLGMGLFVAQESIWEDQRIILKVSTNRRLPSTDPLLSTNGAATTSLRARHLDLYGSSVPERFLKDYNTLTIWASVNPKAFAPQSRWPAWLNLAVGYGSENLYGGFNNTWSDEEGNSYVLSEADYPRYRQLYLSFDIDLKRIPTRRPLVRSVLSILNVIKIPAPALQWNTLGQVKFHPLYF
jgi:hypothetical protein